MKCLLLFAILLTLGGCQSPGRFQGELERAGPSGINLAGPIDHLADFGRRLDGRSTKGNGNSS
jgi:hypothetical protein